MRSICLYTGIVLVTLLAGGTNTESTSVSATNDSGAVATNKVADLPELSEKEFFELPWPLDESETISEPDRSCVGIHPLDEKHARVDIWLLRKWGEVGNVSRPKVAGVAKSYRVQRTPRIEAILKRQQDREAKRLNDIAAGKLTRGMTAQQLIKSKGKHYRRLKMNQQRGGVEVYIYDDVSVQLHFGKVEGWWPAKDNEKKSMDVNWVDWTKIPYEDDINATK